jgi:alpha/beta superfamily hydrolase
MNCIGIGSETCASSWSIDGVMTTNVIQASMTKPKRRMLPALFVDFRRLGAYGGKFADEGRGNTVEYD